MARPLEDGAMAPEVEALGTQRGCTANTDVQCLSGNLQCPLLIPTRCHQTRVC